jgi:MFS family permease
LRFAAKSETQTEIHAANPHTAVRARLSLLMFLQYAAPGAFLPLYSVYLEKLGYSPLTAGCFCATQGVASVLCPLLAGQIADRWIAAERCLAVCSFFVGVIMWLVAGMTDATPAWILFAATLGYWLLTVPILLLGTAVCFAHLPDPARQFGGVRLWGTVGWMVQGWIVLAGRLCISNLSEADCTNALFRLGSVLSFVLCAYSLTLPATPPRPSTLAAEGRGKRRSAPRAAFAALKSWPFLVYCVCTFGLCITFPFMTQGAPLLLKNLAVSEIWLTPLMSLSQATEIVSLALLPLCLLRLGVRTTMLLGLGAWTLSFSCLTVGSPRALMVGALGFNGLCVTGFLVAGQVFVNGQASKEVRASVLGLLTFVNGAGMLLGHVLVGVLRYSLDDQLTRAFSIGAMLTVAMLVLFVFGFREQKPIPASVGEDAASPTVKRKARITMAVAACRIANTAVPASSIPFPS